jgi:1-deoxy-D-xylulose-5-phosphate reductoisomerase
MQYSRKKIIILGSTGSIGTQTLDVVRQHADRLQVVGLSCYSNASELLEQAKQFGVGALVVTNPHISKNPIATELKEHVEGESWRKGGEFAIGGVGTPNPINDQDDDYTHDEFLGFGEEALLELIRESDAQIVVNAMSGAAGLRASIETLNCGKSLALANKESLVVAGDIIMPLAKKQDFIHMCIMTGQEKLAYEYISGKKKNDPIPEQDSTYLPLGAMLPIDSEHGAIFQCLLSENRKMVEKLWITASGGPFFGRTTAELEDITPAQALAHPTWNMGRKISIDSATLMNKGLEVIEAHHLFDMSYEKIEVVVHPQSQIHSMVEFVDGSVKAHLGRTDMRIPIQYALSYPERWETPVERVDFRQLGSLDFAAPDTSTFRCLDLARQAGVRGGTLPCVMNAANEIAVAAFLEGRLTFLGIADCVESVMDSANVHNVVSVDQLVEADQAARDRARRFIESHE